MEHGRGAGEQHRPGEKRFGGMVIPEPEFAADDGSPDPALAEALALHALGEVGLSAVVRALHGKRLMTPLVAVLDSVEDGVSVEAAGPGEKDSHMATVSLVGPDGRRGLLAFTSVASITAWDPAARAIPAAAARVAAAALQEGADAVLLDLAGPIRLAVSGPALVALAEGRDWSPPHEDPAVLAALAHALNGLEGVLGHEVAEAPSGEGAADVLVVLSLAGDSDLVAAVGRAVSALEASDALASTCPRGVAVALVDPA
jgi:hypothetical protein